MNHVPKFQENVSTKNIKNNSRRTNVFRAMVERAAYWTFEGEFTHSCWSEDSSRQCRADQAPSHGESHGYHGPSSPAGSPYYLQLLLRTKDFSLRQKPIVTVTYNYWPIIGGCGGEFFTFLFNSSIYSILFFHRKWAQQLLGFSEPEISPPKLNTNNVTSLNIVIVFILVTFQLRLWLLSLNKFLKKTLLALLLKFLC